MSEAEKEYGIDETMEVFEFLIDSLDGLNEAKQDDDKIDMGEWLKLALSNAPAGVRAFKGADQIDDEMKNLSDEEKNELIKKALELASAAMRLAGVEL